MRELWAIGSAVPFSHSKKSIHISADVAAILFIEQILLSLF